MHFKNIFLNGGKGCIEKYAIKLDIPIYIRVVIFIDLFYSNSVIIISSCFTRF